MTDETTEVKSTLAAVIGLLAIWLLMLTAGTMDYDDAHRAETHQQGQ